MVLTLVEALVPLIVPPSIWRILPPLKVKVSAPSDPAKSVISVNIIFKALSVDVIIPPALLAALPSVVSVVFIFQSTESAIVLWTNKVLLDGSGSLGFIPLTLPVAPKLLRLKVSIPPPPFTFKLVAAALIFTVSEPPLPNISTVSKAWLILNVSFKPAPVNEMPVTVIPPTLSRVTVSCLLLPWYSKSPPLITVSVKSKLVSTVRACKSIKILPPLLASLPPALSVPPEKLIAVSVMSWPAPLEFEVSSVISPVTLLSSTARPVAFLRMISAMTSITSGLVLDVFTSVIVTKPPMRLSPSKVTALPDVVMFNAPVPVLIMGLEPSIPVAIMLPPAFSVISPMMPIVNSSERVVFSVALSASVILPDTASRFISPPLVLIDEPDLNSILFFALNVTLIESFTLPLSRDASVIWPSIIMLLFAWSVRLLCSLSSKLIVASKVILPSSPLAPEPVRIVTPAPLPSAALIAEDRIIESAFVPVNLRLLSSSASSTEGVVGDGGSVLTKLKGTILILYGSINHCPARPPTEPTLTLASSCKYPADVSTNPPSAKPKPCALIVP